VFEPGPLTLMRGDEHIDIHDVEQTSGVHPDEQIVTGEAVALDLRLAGVGSRGVAAIIDLAIVTVAEFVLLFLIAIIGPGGNAATLLTVVLVVEVVIILGYPVAMETLWRGRTLGKAAMGLRVVRDDGGPIRFRHAFVRGLVGVVLDKPGLSVGLLALFPMLISARKKRFGDFFAGTVVLQERVSGQLDAPVAMPPQLAGWAASLDLSGVNDTLALRMRQFLGRAYQFTPDARATLEHQIASEVVSRVGLPPPHTPGWAVISAVLAERRRRAFIATQPIAQPPWQAPMPMPPGQASVTAPAPSTPDGFAPPK
jgi:uncharacterized RDD family membrane protein YckC